MQSTRYFVRMRLLLITILIALDAKIDTSMPGLAVESFTISHWKTSRIYHHAKRTDKTEIVNDFDDENDDEAWVPDRDQNNKKKKRIRNDTKVESEPVVDSHTQPKMRQTYTQEEEEIIQSLGGRDMGSKPSKREPGFLGDCTIREIAHDFQVPIPYLADVLCTWGVPPPIDCNIPIGDMITGEHCFAILEAIHTLDIGGLHDRYSNLDMISLCDEYEIDLKKAFELAIKENWNLPFGVQTHLRVEQEEQMLQELASDEYNF